jgi:hypothetical protein
VASLRGIGTCRSPYPSWDSRAAGCSARTARLGSSPLCGKVCRLSPACRSGGRLECDRARYSRRRPRRRGTTRSASAPLPVRIGLPKKNSAWACEHTCVRDALLVHHREGAGGDFHGASAEVRRVGAAWPRLDTSVWASRLRAFPALMALSGHETRRDNEQQA